MGRRGRNVILGGSVLCVLHWSISYFPSSPPAVRSGAGSTMASTITAHVDLLCCVCANVDGVPLQTSVKIANDFPFTSPF